MQHDAFEARRRLRKGASAPITPPPAFLEEESAEDALHCAILAECQRRGWLAFHGSMRRRSSRTVGEADFCCLLPGGRVLFVECKSKIGKLSSEQLAISRWMAKLGHQYHVVRSFTEFLAIL